MADLHPRVVDSVIVEEHISFTLTELCRACRADSVTLIALVDEGVLEPAGSGPGDWRFSGPALRRARCALRLAHDLDLGLAGAALVLDLLDDIEALKASLRRAGIR